MGKLGLKPRSRQKDVFVVSTADKAIGEQNPVPSSQDPSRSNIAVTNSDNPALVRAEMDGAQESGLGMPEPAEESGRTSWRRRWLIET